MSYKNTAVPNLQQPAPVKMAYFMITTLVYYIREGVLKERHLNLLSEMPVDGAFSKSVLSLLSTKAISRVVTENNIPITDIRDAVILSMSFLGAMTPEEFHREAASSVDPTL